MTIHEANRLLASVQASKTQLTKCHEDLCEEYRYVQRMTATTLYESVVGEKILVEMQSLIKQLENKLLKCTD